MAALLTRAASGAMVFSGFYGLVELGLEAHVSLNCDAIELYGGVDY